MKILGIDFGLKKIGLAISEGELAEPLEVIQKTPETTGRLTDLCKKQGVEKIVIGLPDSGIVEEVKRFGRSLSKKTNLPVVYQPETLTSKDALSKMIASGRSRKFRRQHEDAIAAALILQSYLEEN